MPKLSDNQLQKIRDTWGEVIAHSHQAGEVFYTVLFDLAPSLSDLFKENIKKQDQKLLSAITLIITKLNKLENLNDEVRALAKRHVQYGVPTTHFGVFGKALIHMLENILGDKWDEETKEAWERIYQLISTALKEEMEKAKAEIK
jgi:nitric oxide dioxygenase